ncbi:MAG TPA: GNAT family N-acetyltransferase [Allosphingosinicella sp.]|nr:GNAT family N-acetyltransferase [Allosphingosinicella sp.]
MGARAAPVLETARLILRPIEADDLDAYAAMMAHGPTVKFLGGATLTREEAWRKLLIGPAQWLWLGYGYWAVERKDDGRLIGQLGFADFKRDMAPGIEGLPEMGWAFHLDVAGQGYASEAAAAALAWIDEALAPGEIVAIIDEANLASIRVAEKAGFAQKETARYKSEPILLFRRRAPGAIA